MSEEQVLPELDVKVKVESALSMISALSAPRGTEGAREWIMSIPARFDHDPDLVISGAIYALKNALAQSEAERERLKGELVTVLARESATTARYDAKMDQLLADGTKAAEELARVRETANFWLDAHAGQRELNQGLRQVVKEYRYLDRSIAHRETCRFRRYPDWKVLQDDRCTTCIKADALLAPPTDPNKEEGTL